ncbi:MAG: ABC-F family ATP-binding cassette domain-containing protein [Gaiellaceae bacterium]
MAGTLVARDLSRSHGGTAVLDGVSLVVAPGSRIGVVGPNGIGKTTLLRTLAALEPPDGGTLTRAPAGLSVGYLPQEQDARPDETLLAYLTRRTGVAEAESELDRRAAELPDGIAEHAEALERFLVAGGADLEARAQTVCAELGLPADRLGVRVGDLSGGQRARAALAAILLARVDVLLLDEPTNDLDFAGLDRLERFLDRFEGGAVVVSHDRAFLERTIDTVIELEAETRRVREYGGGFALFEELRALARVHERTAFEEYVDRRSSLQGQAQQQREWARVGVVKAKKGKTDNAKVRWNAAAQRAESRGADAAKLDRKLERLERVDKPWEPWQLQLEIAPAKRSGEVVARLEAAVVERGSFRLGPIDLELGWGDRLAVVGPNGSGKTTLIGALLGTIPLAAGRRYVGPGVELGYLEQERLRFGGETSLAEQFAGESGLKQGEARTLLAKYGLGAEHVLRPGGSLSPGERTRASIALFSALGVNALVLDEPTNHRDLPAIEELEQALLGYPGTVLLVTHDRRFLESFRQTAILELT